MNPSSSTNAPGRSRGRGRGNYQHPPPFHAKDGHPGPQREPWNLIQGAPRPPAPQPGRQIIGAPLPVKHSSDSDSGPRGRGHPKAAAHSGSDPTRQIQYPEARPQEQNVRGLARTQRPEYTMVKTRPNEVLSKVGTTGQKITCEANFFRLQKTPEWQIYLYRVDFRPDVMDVRTRRFIVGTQREMFGGYLFDGTQLFLTQMLDSETVVKVVHLEREQSDIEMTIRFTSIISMTEQQSLQVLNLILRNAMDGLELETVGRNKFDPAAAIPVPNLRLEIWPGYITSIRQHEEDILVCAEISHKIMRNETILDIIRNIRTENRDFKMKVEQVLLGSTVLTKYNNKTYRIDEITYDVTPRHTFKRREQDVSYIDYYQQKYKLEIRDPSQPMLISRLKMKDVRGQRIEDEQECLLVPELCFATGLTDEMRSNFRTMRELSQHTKVGPSSRCEKLIAFNRRLAAAPKSAKHLTDWKLALDPNLVKIPARILPYPDLLFGNDRKAATNIRADWTSEFRNNSMFRSIELKRWHLITPVRCKKEAQDFVGQLQRAGRGMQFLIANPRYVEVHQDSQTIVSQQIGDCASQNPQLIMCVVSNNQGDRYSTIKKRCYLDFGLPSQVMVQKTITPKDKIKGASGLLSVATKVAIQMNVKLGGLPWMIGMPLSGLMTFGYDTCHDPKNKSKSWGALVATMDLKKQNNEFFTAINQHKSGEEISNHMKENIPKALHQFQQINNSLPERILFFRDGVSDGQIQYVHEHEVKAIKDSLKSVYERFGLTEPQFLYMIVTKRVNTRIFFDRKNPDPGTCVDDVITLPERYDFYLISQTVREGTVSPTGFNIIHDTLGIPPDRIQQLTFRFCYFYFNWSGTVRVPAMCQYAHKLAFLASQSLQSTPTGENSRQLQRTLYFL